MMAMLCVTSPGLAKQLVTEGALLLQQRRDVNGEFVWFFDANRLSFDIGDAVQRGDAFYSSTMSIAF